MQEFLILDNGRPSHVISTRDEIAALMQAHQMGAAPAGLRAVLLADYVQQMDRQASRAGLPFALVAEAATGARGAYVDEQGQIWAPLPTPAVVDVLKAWHGC